MNKTTVFATMGVVILTLILTFIFTYPKAPQLPSPSPSPTSQGNEVFAVGPNYKYRKIDAEGVCRYNNASVATLQQLKDAQKAGAEWCFTGWIKDDDKDNISVAKYPMQSANQECGNRAGIIDNTPSPLAGVNCYGVKPASTDTDVFPFNNNKWNQDKAGSSEVFAVGPEYKYAKEDAQNICGKKGAKVATLQQLVDAQKAGAEWCFTGWLSDDNDAKYPMQEAKEGCGGGPGIMTYTPPQLAGVNCYGSKPNKYNKNILQFNNEKWYK